MPLPLHIQWIHPCGLRLLDQRCLPGEVVHREYHTAVQVASAIADMVVRGAPAIGIAAAYGMVLAVPPCEDIKASQVKKSLKDAAHALKSARPTAVNLSWAVDRMARLAADLIADGADPESLSEAMLDEARRIHEEDLLSCRSIGAHGLSLVPENARILTHCNAGALATGGYGTALGVIRSAHSEGRVATVYCDETRPYLQGARLTAWELTQDGIPATVICDSMAGALLSGNEVDLVVVGADRIARNGDTANKIGTYPLAVLASRHKVPFYVAAPSSTFDPLIPDGTSIPIEERDAAEVTSWMGSPLAPAEASARHIAFDVTPHELITAIITEHGLAQPVDEVSVGRILNRSIT
jgi:methylthioribose-1-phosphate isomerase